MIKITKKKQKFPFSRNEYSTETESSRECSRSPRIVAFYCNIKFALNPKISAN